ncbi:hypothetical protein BH24ACT6_BH24ACT6_04740 [soil metagenome]
MQATGVAFAEELTDEHDGRIALFIDILSLYSSSAMWWVVSWRL